MANSNHNNTNHSNQMNPENVYGLNEKTCCSHGPYLPNTMEEMYASPINEISSFNQSTTANPIDQYNENLSLMQADEAERQGGSTSGPPSQFNGNLQKIPYVEKIDAADTAIPEPISTPATTLNYGATMSAPMKANLGMAPDANTKALTVTPESIQFHNGFLRTQVGRRVSVDFLLGSNTIVTKSGYLLGVAQDYILINELDTNDITSCDFYNIKFMRFYY